MINSNDKIYVAGHNGMVGSAIVRKLREKGFLNIITRSSSELDLTNQQNVHNFLHDEKPDYVVISAAKVGGIYANDSYPAEFIYQNLMIESNIIHGSYLAGVNNLLFLGSSCIYPKESQQPIKEEYLLNGYLEPTNEPYAIAKIAGIKLCESYNRQFNRDYRSVMPTNLYGPGDNYHPENSHVIPALIRKFHNAKINNDRQVVVRVDSRYFRPTEVNTLLGDSKKARQKLGWRAKVSFKDLVKEMVSCDLKDAKKDKLCLEKGFSTLDYHE